MGDTAACVQGHDTTRASLHEREIISAATCFSFFVLIGSSAGQASDRQPQISRRAVITGSVSHRGYTHGAHPSGGVGLEVLDVMSFPVVRQREVKK